MGDRKLHPYLWLRILPIAMLLITAPAAPLHAQRQQASLRFHGTGRDGIDRVIIPLDAPHRSVDVGADFTIEFWLRANPGDNGGGGCGPQADAWITGNILIDRDVYGPGDSGDYGVALSEGRIAFGVHNGTDGATVCGATNIADGAWHHIAVTRRSDGPIAVFVDGRRDAQAAGPAGDISYRDGRATDYPNDPYLVLGAEKHDAGAEYPSFRGWLDELRISQTVRYDAEFSRPSTPFDRDEATVALYHFDEGSGAIVIDSAEAGSTPNNGDIRYGGSPIGPEWSTETPFSVNSPTAAPTMPAAPTEAAPTTISTAQEGWTRSFSGGTSYEVDGIVIVKTNPQSVTEIANYTSAGFETNSADTFVLTTAPFYTPEGSYAIMRINLLDGSTQRLVLNATPDGRLALRLPPGQLKIEIAAIELPTASATPVLDVPAPPSPQPVPATMLPLPGAEPPTTATPGSTSSGEPGDAQGQSGGSFMLQALLIGLVVVSLVWLARRRSA